MPQKPTYDELQLSLNVAVGLLSELEPGDSRAVSDIFVALAAVVCGVSDATCIQAIEAEAARQRAHALVPQLDLTVPSRARIASAASGPALPTGENHYPAVL